MIKIPQKYDYSQLDFYNKKTNNNQAMPCSSKLSISIVFIFLILVSSYFLLQIIIQNHQQMHPTSTLRLSFLEAGHIVLMVALAFMPYVQDIYQFVVLAFLTCFINTIMFSVCETYVKKNQEHPFVELGRMHVEKLEITYLNVYFLSYLYSITGSFVLGIFVSATQGIVCYQKHHILSNIQSYLIERKFEQLTENQRQCSICINDFTADDRTLVKLKNCGHVFHKRCIIEWINYNQQCPNDRSNIFEEQPER